MGVTTTKTNKPFNPRGNDQSPLAYNKAAIYSGKALDFDGVNDSVDLDGFTMAGDVATIVFYGKFSNDGRILDLSPNRFIIENAAGIGLRVFNNTSYTVYGTTDRNKVGFYAIVSDGITQRAYYNGHQLGSDATITALDWDSVTNMKLGSYFGGGSVFLDGQIAGVKIFNTALTAAQIADLYNNPEKIVPTGVDDTALKLWLPMQEGAGTTAYDGSGNGNHGTISGATYVNGVGAPVAQTAVIDWNKGSNLFTHSQALSNWTQLNTITTDNSAISPDGTQNSSKLVATSGVNNNVIYQGTTAGTYTASMFAKKGEFEGIVIATGNVGAFFNLNTNTYRTYYGSAPTSYNIEDFGNGWHRFSITFTEAGANNIYIGPNDNVSNTLGVTGNNSDGIYIFGVQIKTGTAGPYIPTFATAQPSPVLLPQGLTTGRDITGVNLFENVRKQGALNLDGSSFAEVHDNASLDLTDAISLECWYFNDGAADKGLLGRYFSGKRSYLLYATSNKIEFFTNTASTFKTGLSAGWHHIVGTYDKVNRKLYVNGALEDTDAYTTAISTNDEPIEIGRYFGNAAGARSYTNQIAQPRIYNRALTAEEIQRNYSAGKNIYS